MNDLLALVYKNEKLAICSGLVNIKGGRIKKYI